MGTKAEKTNERPGSVEVMELKELYELMLVEGLDVLELKDDDSRIYMNRRRAMTPSLPIHGGVPVRRTSGGGVTAAEPPAKPAETIKAPLAGVFYRSGAPTRPPFVQAGDIVEAGQTLCIIEAMKVMNEIKAEKRCRIAKIAAENSRPVAVEQDLFWIESA